MTSARLHWNARTVKVVGDGRANEGNDLHVKEPRWRTLLAIALTLVAAACSGGTSGSKPGSSPIAVRGQIAFVSKPGGQADIFVTNADGTGRRRLTNNPAKDIGPTWSPDGTKIAFISDRDRAGDFEIYVMNADGSGVKRLTDAPGSSGFPAWSPDGSKIAFASDRAGDFEIYVMIADGTGVRRLTNDPAADLGPAWSRRFEVGLRQGSWRHQLRDLRDECGRHGGEAAHERCRH
jgi:dipeptidyl aminopeptidase/acylaminoacyl peptidase